MSSIRYFNLIKKIRFTANISQSIDLIVKNRIINKQQTRTIFTTILNKSNNDNTTSVEQTKPSEGEQKLIDLLKNRFPKAKTIEVVDISGGCGAMYTIYVETSEFKNLRTVKQHQLINECLKHEIKNNMHGLRIQTAVPKE